MAPLAAALTQQVWALALVLPCLVVSIGAVGLGPLPTGTGWLLVTATEMTSYLVPFALYLTALESLTAPVAAQFLSLIPLAGLLGSATILGEPIGRRSLAGAGLVVGALYLPSPADGPAPT